MLPIFERSLASVLIGGMSDLGQRATEADFRKKNSPLAEREGFEPSVPRKRDNGFRDRPDRPLRHLSV